MAFPRRRVVGIGLVLLGIVAAAALLEPFWSARVHVRHFVIERDTLTPHTLKPYQSVVVRSENDLDDLVAGLRAAIRLRYEHDDEGFTARQLDEAIRGRAIDFTRETLVVIPHQAGSGSIQVGLRPWRISDGKLVLEITRNSPIMRTADMAFHVFAVVVPRGRVRDLEIWSRGAIAETVFLDDDPQDALVEYRRLRKQSIAIAGQMEESTLRFRPRATSPAYRGIGQLPAIEFRALRLPRYFPGAADHWPGPPQPHGADVSYTNITDAGVAELARLPNIRALNLNGTAVTAAGLRHLPALDSLESLSLNDVRVDDGVLKSLAGCRRLRSLFIGRTTATGPGLEELASPPQLTTLSVEVPKDGLKHLAKLTRLEELHIGGPIADEELKELASLVKLQTLWLHSRSVTGIGLKSLGHLPRLTTISLDGDSFTNEGVKELAELPHLEAITLWGARNVTDLTPLASLPKLRFLRLGFTPIPEGLAPLAGLTTLDTLILSQNEATDEGVETLSKLPRLKHLDLSNCHRVTQAAAKPLSTMSQLESLSLAGTQMTDAGVIQLAALKQLRVLDVNHSRVTDLGRAELQHRRPELTIVPR